MISKAAQEWFRDVQEVGCIVCRLQLGVYSPCDIHHMLQGGRRMGHLFSFGLCPNHHRSGMNNEQAVSRDQNRKRFEAKYGTEAFLLQKTREAVMALRAQRLPTIHQLGGDLKPIAPLHRRAHEEAAHHLPAVPRRSEVEADPGHGGLGDPALQG